MHRSILAAVAILVTTASVAFSGALPHSYAQSTGPVGDEFTSTGLLPPFHAVCATLAPKPCPDAPATGTWNVNQESAGQLRIWSLFGSLVGGPSQGSNTARNMILQPVDPAVNWTVTTKMTFPAASNAGAPIALGQTAGLLVYQDDDNFIYLGRQYTPAGTPQIQFLQEVGGTSYLTAVPETGIPVQPVYLRLVKTGTLYQAFTSPDNVNFTAIPPAVPAPTVTTTPTGTGTSTPGTPTNTPTAPTAPTGYTAAYTAPQVGLFAWGGTDARATQNLLAADFDWFRVGSNSQTPAATAAPTSTNTPVTTSTTVPTSTVTVTATATATATATVTPVPPTPTPTPKPRPASAPKFQFISLWYHTVRQGTFDVITIQANHKRALGIWAHVYFPNGRHYDWYTNTDNSGRWSARFNIPRKVITKHSNQGVITLQLWQGSKTRKAFLNFTLV